MSPKPLDFHEKKLAVGDEVYRVRFSRYGNVYTKGKVEKIYKNSNAVVLGDQFRCRESFDGGWRYTQTGERSRWSADDGLWPVTPAVEEQIAKEKAQLAHQERARVLRERLTTTNFREMSPEQLTVMEKALDSVTEKEKT